jgi:hypothetical protein
VSAEIVNLRQRRKRQARQDAEAEATENRAKFGQPKPARDQRKAEAERAQRALDAKKITPPRDG